MALRGTLMREIPLLATDRQIPPFAARSRFMRASGPEGGSKGDPPATSDELRFWISKEPALGGALTMKTQLTVCAAVLVLCACGPKAQISGGKQGASEA